MANSGHVPLRMVSVYYDEDGNTVCPVCLEDVRRGGAMLTRGRVPANRYECEYCHEVITQ